jgi:hypothetical protein
MLKKRIRPFQVLIILSGCLSVFGCRPQKLPEGMPPLYPCTVTITQEGTPLEGASVTLHPLTEDKSWVPGGTTDSNGSVRLKILGQYPGAPAGTYKVTVKKNGTEEVTSNSFYTLSFVEERYARVRETPLEMEVTAEGIRQTFEVGKRGSRRISGLVKLDSSPQ